MKNLIIFALIILPCILTTNLRYNSLFEQLNIVEQTNNFTLAQQQAEALAAKLTQGQLLSLLSGVDGNYVGNVNGIPEFNIPPLKLNDGPNGFRCPNQSYNGTSTQFPSALTMAATWDRNVVFDYGDHMGKEFYDKGANIQLGPGVNLARVPNNGRIYEYISGEDPFLGRELVFQAVSGIQSRGSAEENTTRNSSIIATTKHFADKQFELNFNDNVNVDDRTNMEMYFQPFMGGLKAQTGAVMCSYNRINGYYSCQNSNTLLGYNDSKIGLKNYLGFQGWVMSDWGACHNVSIEQGLDMQMPDGADFGQPLQDMITNKSIPFSFVNQSAIRILTQFFYNGIMADNNTNSPFANVTNDFQRQKAKEFARNGTVLLKNDNNVLPLNLKNLKNIVIVGDQAQNPITGGCGSGQVNPCCVVTPLQAITQYVGSNATIKYYSEINSEALTAAANASVTIVFIGNLSCEGTDLPELPFGDIQNNMVFQLASVSSNIVVVAASPGPFIVPFDEYVDAILIPFMPGEQYGNAITETLFGIDGVVPTGKLPLTVANFNNEMNFTQLQYPGVWNETAGYYEVNYTEGIFFGYRWYGQNNVQPKYCFGHGLSYTTFSYSNLSVTFQPGSRMVSATVKNTGSVTGSEVAQLYLQFPQTVNNSAVNYPPKVLKGFEKVTLPPGQSQTVTFNVTDFDVSIFNVVLQNNWFAVYGEFGVNVGSSSCDIRLNGNFTFPQVNATISSKF